MQGLRLRKTFDNGRFRDEIPGVLRQIALLAQLVNFTRVCESMPNVVGNVWIAGW
ncbi:MAG: hypothetical protein ACREUL_06340 [Steroidobacteraceae bacterium]